MNESGRKKFNELYDQWEDMRGTKIINMTKHLAISHYTLNRNYKEISEAIKFYEDDPTIWHNENRKKRQFFLREFLRFLHNYLASVKSLIDHTRNFSKHLNNSQFKREYKKEIKKRKIKEKGEFLRDLRNYTLHYQLPIAQATLFFKNGNSPMQKKITLDKQDLLRWNGWKSHSKKYIEKHEREIDLKVAISEYHELITEFYKWMYRRVKEIFFEQIKESCNMKNKLLELYKKEYSS